ncbi:hypothetical protein L7F22_047060 [Adiantum nelumboides]|nr:hypothetical protein [Adiantum nelumboides]
MIDVVTYGLQIISKAKEDDAKAYGELWPSALKMAERDLLSIYAYIAKFEANEAWVEERRKRDEEAAGSSKRATKSNNKKEEVPKPSLEVNMEDAPKDKKQGKPRGPSYRLKSDIELATNLKKDALKAEHSSEPVHDTSMLHRQVEWDCSSEPQLEAVRRSSHRHRDQVDSLDAHGESSCMVAEMADLETNDALVVQSFLDACMSEQSSELVVQESMSDRDVERSCTRDAHQCKASTRQMAMTDDSIIQTFLDMLDREHVDASSLDELTRSASIASAFCGLMYEMLISTPDIAVAVGALAVGVVSQLVTDAGIGHGGAMQVLCRHLHEASPGFRPHLRLSDYQSGLWEGALHLSDILSRASPSLATSEIDNSTATFSTRRSRNARGDDGVHFRNSRSLLASLKEIPRRCAPYLCCCCTPVGKEATSFKVEPVHPTSWQRDASVTPVVPEAAPPPPPRDAFMEDDTVSLPTNEVTAVKLGPPLKSSLKRPPSRCFSAQDGANVKCDRKKENSVVDGPILLEKRSITWVDTHGKQLTEVKEFEPRLRGSAMGVGQISSLIRMCGPSIAREVPMILGWSFS